MLPESTSKTAGTSFVNGLKKEISDLEMDNIYLRNELIDTTKTARLIIDFTYTISELISKNLDFAKKNGHTPALLESREKLIYLMNCGELFNSISNQNSTLKIDNRNLLSQLQQVRQQLVEIKRQEGLTV